MSATVLWIMLTLDPRPRPCPWSESTPAERRLSVHYRAGLSPNGEACRLAYLRKVGSR